MEQHIRNNISNIIDKKNIKHKDISKSDLITLILYKTFQKKYYSNTYKNSLVLKDLDNALWNSTGFMSEVGITGIGGVVCSPDSESDYDSQFAWEDESQLLIKQEDYNDIKKIYLAFKKANNIKESVRNIKEIAETNPESLFLFKSLFHNELSYQDFYKETMENITMSSNISNIYKNSIPSKIKGELIRSSKNITDDNFNNYKEEMFSRIDKKMKRLKNLDVLLNKYNKQINIINDELDIIYPELNDKPNVNELEFFFIETKQNISNRFSNNKFEAVDKSEFSIKNRESFSDFYKQEKNLIDFIQENPLSFSNYNASKINEIEGLSYLTDDLLKPSDYSSQFFLIAKTKRGETVGSLSLDKPNAYKHLFKITGVCVKNSFRGNGVARKIYEKLAQISIDNDLIIHNNNYTNDGKQYLPKMKMDILNNNNKFVLIDEYLENSIPVTYINNALERYNKLILSQIKSQEMEKSIDHKKTIKAYLSGKKVILSELNQTPRFTQEELCNKGCDKFLETIEEKPRSKQKNRMQ